MDNSRESKEDTNTLSTKISLLTSTNKFPTCGYVKMEPGMMLSRIGIFLFGWDV